jgi:hypothetical protein
MYRRGLYPPSKNLHARQSSDPFIRRLNATTIPTSNTMTTKELADGSQAGYLLCICPTVGAKPFRDRLFPNGRVQVSAWSHFSTLYLVLYGQEQAEFASHF